MSSGSHTIAVPLVLAASADVGPAAGTRLAISGNISESSPGMALSLDGPGTLVLTGTNSYSGGTYVNEGTLVIDNGQAIQDGTGLSVGAGGRSSSIRR